MKRSVWENKSNGQLCVTIPKSAGIVAGEVVSLSKHKVSTIVYSSVTADLFHYGQLQLLHKANELGDLHICGVLTNKAMKDYREAPIADFKERQDIVSSLRCVDMTMAQHSLDPTENLKKIHEQFPHASITIVYGSNWKEVPGAAYIKSINGKIVQPAYYEKLSKEKMIKKILHTYGEKKK